MTPTLLAFAALTAIANPPAADPAAMRIDAFYPVLAETVTHAKTLGFDGRVAKLRPAVDELFAFPNMAQFAVGARWSAMSPAERRSIIDALSRYTARSYAYNFSGNSAYKFGVDPNVKTHGADKLVKTTITSSRDAPVDVSYRMREYDGHWKVIDVYYNAVSQVVAQRSEFAAVLSSGGASALVTGLDKKMLGPQ